MVAAASDEDDTQPVAQHRGARATLRWLFNIVLEAHLDAMPAGSPLEQVFEAALWNRQDVQWIAGPDAELERERAELETWRRPHTQ